MKNLLIGILLALSLCNTVQADNSISGTGNELIGLCNDRNYTASNANWGYCIGYVVGVTEGEDWGVMLSVMHYESKKSYDQAQHVRAKIAGFCVPDDATHEQLALVVTKYLKDHPAELNQLSHILVDKAFGDVWSCSNDKK